MESQRNEGEQQPTEAASVSNDRLGGTLNMVKCPHCGSFNTYIFMCPQHRLVTEGDSFWFVALSEKVCEMCGHRWERKESEGVHASWS